MKRLFSLLLICALLLSGCAPKQKASGAPFYTFTDNAGTQISLNARPERVAVLFSSLAELWQLAGGEVSVTVGESVQRGFCGEDIPLVDGGAGKTVNIEALIAEKPDFVIASADIPAQVDAAAQLRNAGIPCALIRVEDFSEYLSALNLFTAITGDTDAYRTYGTDLRDQIEGILEKTEGKASPKILFIRSGSKASSAKAKTASQHFAAAMLAELGAQNIADAAPILLDGLSVEAVLQEDPDYIFISPMGDEQAAKAYMESVFSQPAWQALSAIKDQNYAYLSKDLFQYKPNARWAEAYQTLAESLYPERF